QTVGQAFGDTITALDGYGNVATSYSGAEILVFSDPSNAPNGALPTYPSPVPLTAGVGTASNITLVDAQTTTLTAAQTPITGTSNDFVVSAGLISTFDVANPVPQTVGQAFGDTLTALDGYGNVATSYSGAEILVFSDPSNAPNGALPIYPSPVTFTAGVGTASNITLVDAQTTTLTATQTPITGTSNDFVVSAGLISTFDVANPGPQTVGQAFGDTITALDGYGNVATSYSGAEILVFSDPSNAPNGALPTY